VTTRISQFHFYFYRHRPIHCDFSGGQITSDAGLLQLRAFDERHHLTNDWAALLSDPRQDDRVLHHSLALLRQRVYQIVAGYEDANDADRLRHDPALQIVADQELGVPLGSQPTLSRWENAPSAHHRSLEAALPSLRTRGTRHLVSDLHDRMPVIVPPDKYDLWLDPDITAFEAIRDILKPYDPELMLRYPVSTRLNNSKNDDAESAAPVTLDIGSQDKLF
jgi:hypothetical protein